MRIAIVSDPMIPVPPINYGGIERIIDFLATGLRKLGHEVVLVAHASSTNNVNFKGYPNSGNNWRDHLRNAITVASLSKFKPDVIHSFGRLAYLVAHMRSPTPKIMSYQREPTISQIQKAVTLSKRGSLSFTGCSNYITNKIKPFATANTVYNGVDVDIYKFQPTISSDAPLVFLGRIEPIKGTHTSVQLALNTGRQLIIAGNIPPEHQAYFDAKVAPYLGKQVHYVGAVNDNQKNDLLGQAAALLMPIEWNEPFGIVMCEAMACGTPVIGIGRGSVPEVIQDTVSGFVCNDIVEMEQAISKIHLIDRRSTRKQCEQRFGSQVIVDGYLKLYQSALTR